MREHYGDIWEWAEKESAEVVIPTNIGWRANGSNVMGRGVALQAAQRYPGVSAWYGAICQACGPFTPVVIHPEHPLIFFPVKPLDYDDPNLSWRKKASIQLIQKSAIQLSKLRLGKVGVPMVGCGNGGLTEMSVFPALYTILSEDHFTLVRLPG